MAVHSAHTHTHMEMNWFQAAFVSWSRRAGLASGGRRSRPFPAGTRGGWVVRRVLRSSSSGNRYLAWPTIQVHVENLGRVSPSLLPHGCCGGRCFARHRSLEIPISGVYQSASLLALNSAFSKHLETQQRQQCTTTRQAWCSTKQGLPLPPPPPTKRSFFMDPTSLVLGRGSDRNQSVGFRVNSG
ncbi:uncharacterized protein B0I36DRAFT_335930 [Microdochium trichocladiopsis]|uniref:Uncharacterized protein n=1 Tax=Microdochium trichocladiopsis TaxID=1682393 RepID=A0A9P8XV15_9PEZI|nr:uncharacterized protein B0I36DRAFT_335930 [Microdochium trichocladiopsis]KAH7018416.1 hypothetical protein B0I36DRAFT_335930 [Microdochium trichocladiopsis]